jgi:hypothetical protein
MIPMPQADVAAASAMVTCLIVAWGTRAAITTLSDTAPVAPSM